MTLTDALMILAVLLAPLVAVQVSRWLDERRERRDRQLRVFRTLMATRTQKVSADHVQALNMIDLEFHLGNAKEKPSRQHGGRTSTI